MHCRTYDVQKRVMGKASFCNISGPAVEIFSLMWQETVSEKSHIQDFKKHGYRRYSSVSKVKYSRQRQVRFLSMRSAVKLLSKSLQILPEKFHGLTDTDTRYRQRYVDLIMNPEVQDTFIKRSKIISAVSAVIWTDRDSWKLRLRCWYANAGGAAARPFETHFNALNEDLKLRISLELYLKRLIVGGT